MKSTGRPCSPLTNAMVMMEGLQLPSSRTYGGAGTLPVKTSVRGAIQLAMEFLPGFESGPV